MREFIKASLPLKYAIGGLSFILFLSACDKKELEFKTDTSTQELDTFTRVPSEEELLGIGAVTNTLSLKVTGYDLTSSLPKNHVKDGSVDYTTYLQAAISKNSIVTMPAFPVMVNDRGLLIPSDRTINFIKGSKLVLKPTAKGNYNLMRLEKVKNVIINNPNIEGDLGKHLGTSGEWGHGIAVVSSSNVTINGGIITNCWGDGIYLGTTSHITNSNVLIKNVMLTKNRRSGMSIISANGLTLESITASHTKGASPMTGINFEAETYRDQMKNIKIVNCKTEYNASYGLQIGLSNLYKGSNQSIDFVIDNHYDKKSLRGFKSSVLIEKRTGSETITGNIVLNNPYWRENSESPLMASLTEPKVKLIINKPAVMDKNGVFLRGTALNTLLTHKTNISKIANYSIAY